MLELSIELVPAAGKVVSPEAALKMAQVVLDALPEEEEGRLEV
jgi:hypothetical protein